MASLEVTLDNLAKAGITDLYLETFYHGLTTGKAGVFRARFGNDYLSEAIARAARYGIRVTAWVETAYWQYGTSGKYLFDAHPDWRAISVATGLPGGDSSGQVFANLCHPGVRQQMRDYAAELASVPGLWGVQTDYHRFPVDDATSDAYTAPWSYDPYSNTAFQALYGTGADILTKAAKPGQTYWSQFLAWRKAQIGEAAHQMLLGIRGVSPDVVFSGSVFPNPSASSELAKCQDWPTWVANGFLDWVVPMAYSSTTSGILQDLNRARGKAGSARLVAGLAATSGHPALTDQLAAILPSGYEDFAVFEASTLATAANQTALRQWLQTHATKMRADLDDDGVLDLRDLSEFWRTYRGAPIPAAGLPPRIDADGNGTIDSSDHFRLRDAIRRYRLGDNGVLTDSDRSAFEACVTGSGPGTGWTGTNRLWDLDGDGDVDADDRPLLDLIGSQLPMAFVEVVLADTVASPERTVRFEWRHPVFGSSLGHWTARLDGLGRAVLPVPQAGTLELSLKVSHWLRGTATIEVGTSDVGGNMLTLVNGDVDGDDAVTVFDYNLLSDAFDSAAGDPGWNTEADLDEDGAVTVFDYNVLSAAFDLLGG